MLFTIAFKVIVFAHFYFGNIACCPVRNDLGVQNQITDPNIPAIANYFTTKGRYEEANPYLLKDILAVRKSPQTKYADQCREIHLTAIIRHGTRYPTTKDVKKIRQLYDLVMDKANGQQSWLEEIKKLDMWYTEEMDGRLVEKGQDDHRHLAVRLSKLFPLVMSEEKLRGGRMKFMTSSKHRCVNSTLSFIEGLTGLWDIKDQQFDYKVDDRLMRFFDQCEKFVKAVEEDPTALAEKDKFEARPEMRRVLEKIADRLNVPYNDINADMGEAAFYMCAYEFAIKTVNSPWCELFDKTDAQILEYANDLYEYWKRGYGHDINSKSSCNLFHDVFERLDKAANETRSKVEVTEAVTIQVGHAETLLPVITLLGLFNDSLPLTHTNFASQGNRTFLTSCIMPYATNLVLVLYDCGEQGLRLQLWLNEKPLEFPDMHTDQGLPPRYDDVKEHYKDLLEGCDFDKECKWSPNTTESV